MAQEMNKDWYIHGKWMDALSDEDKAALLEDLRQAAEAATADNMEPVKRTLGDWAITASTLTEPEVAAVLLSDAPFHPNDFVAAERPA